MSLVIVNKLGFVKSLGCTEEVVISMPQGMIAPVKVHITSPSKLSTFIIRLLIGIITLWRTTSSHLREVIRFLFNTPSKMLSLLKHPIIQATFLLTTFAILSATLVALSFNITDEQIKINERMTLLRSLDDIIPRDRYDNDLFQDYQEMTDTTLFGDEPVMVYRARQGEKPVAAIFNPVTPEGYNGSIRLLVGVHYDGTLGGVRVISHQETPGLGDLIDLRKAKWILSFTGRSLNDPKEGAWRVKRDGGIFDQFAGATITPRAVIKMIKNTLLFYQKYKKEIFECVHEIEGTCTQKTP